MINSRAIHRSMAITMAVFLCASFAQARSVVETSDGIRPHWCERTDDIMRYNYSYEYTCVISTGLDLLPLRENRILRLKSYFQSQYKIEGETKTEYSHSNEMGNVYDSDSYFITFHTNTSTKTFECVFIDEYWEKYDDGEYRLYSLFAIPASEIEPHFDTYTLSTHYMPSEGLVRSLVPGWGQIYKGSKIKGGLIIAGEALGVGGIIFSYSMKSSYEKLIKEDPKHMKEYSMSADMWQNIGYGCIAFTAAVYVYNLIDAAVAPGARRVMVLPKQVSVAPAVTFDGSLCITMKYNF